MAAWTSVARGATELVVSEGIEMLGVVQAAGRYSLMSPAQVVVRWIGQPSSIIVAIGESGGRSREWRLVPGMARKAVAPPSRWWL